MPALTRHDLAGVLSATTGLTRQISRVAVDAIFQAVAQALRDAGRVELRGFGSFQVVRHAGGVGRNPRQPKVRVPYAPRRKVRFKAGRELARQLNAGAGP